MIVLKEFTSFPLSTQRKDAEVDETTWLQGSLCLLSSVFSPATKMRTVKSGHFHLLKETPSGTRGVCISGGFVALESFYGPF